MPDSYWSAEYCIQKTQKKLYKLMRIYVEKITLLLYTVFNNWTWSIKKPVNIEKASIRASQLISSMCSKCYFTSLRNLLFSLLSILQCILSIKLRSKIENRLNKFNNLLMIVVTINMKEERNSRFIWCSQAHPIWNIYLNENKFMMRYPLQDRSLK